MVNVVVRSVCLVVIGVLMVLLREAFMPVIIQLMGVAFVVSGVISLFNAYLLHRHKLSGGVGKFTLATAGVAGVALGVWLLLSPAFFLSLLMLMLGLMLLFMGMYQLITLLMVQRRLHMRLFVYVIPLLLLAMGVLVIANPFEAAAVPFLVVGAGAMLAGFSDLINSLYLMRRSTALKH